MKAAPPIGLRHRTSPTLIAATALVVALALIAAFNVAGPAWLHIVWVALIVACTVAAALRLWRPLVESLVWRADGGVELRLRARAPGGDSDVLGALQGSRVLGPLIVLTVRWPPRGSASLWLLPDNLDADTRRRLRMRLGAAPGGTAVSGNADSR